MAAVAKDQRADAPPATRVIRAIERLLDRTSVRRVLRATVGGPPPELADVVSFPRLSITLSGHDRMEYARHGFPTTARMRSGDAVLIPANCWNRPIWSTPTRTLTFLFGKKQTGVSLVTHAGGPHEPRDAIKMHLAAPKGPCASILDILLTLPPPTGDAGHRHCASVPLVEALLRCYLALLREPRRSADGHGKAEHTFQNICLYIQENFRHPLTREGVAEHFQRSPSHVSRLFQSRGLMTFSDYLSLVRVDRAKFLLRQYDIKLSAIAANCGFSDVTYFCRVFKQRTSLTPGAFRLRYGAAAPNRD